MATQHGTVHQSLQSLSCVPFALRTVVHLGPKVEKSTPAHFITQWRGAGLPKPQPTSPASVKRAIPSPERGPNTRSLRIPISDCRYLLKCGRPSEAVEIDYKIKQEVRMNHEEKQACKVNCVDTPSHVVSLLPRIYTLSTQHWPKHTYSNIPGSAKFA